MTGRQAYAGAQSLAVYGIAAALFAGLSVGLGKDVNWDLQAYHAYAPWALLHGAYARDVFAGNWQGYLNPTIYLVRYGLVTHLPPMAAGAALAAIQALNIPILYAIAWRLLAAEPRNVRVALSLLATALGGLSAVFISEIGTSFADILVSIPVLGALFLALPGDEKDLAQPRWRRLATAGGLMGAAFGLKLTNHVLVVAFAAAVAVGWTSWRQRLRAVLPVALGGALGTAATALPWALRLQHDFGNPLFPIVGAESTVENVIDLRFRPNGVLEALSYPWRWATGGPAGTEMPFVDIRPIVLLAVLMLALCAALLRRPAAVVDDLRGRVGRRRVGIFLAIGTALWLGTSGIHRYAMALDLLVGPATVVCFARALSRRLALVASTVLVGAALITVEPPDWARAEWTRTWFDVDLPADLRVPATYVLPPRSRMPLGFLPEFFPAGSVFVQSAFPAMVTPGSMLERRARAILAGAVAGSTFLLLDAAPDAGAARIVRELGFGLAAPCRAIRTALRPVAACPLVRAVQAADDDVPLLAVGEWSAPGWPGDGSLLLGEGWSDAEPWGRWAVGPRSTVRFRSGGVGSGPAVLDFVGHGFVGPGLRALNVGVYIDGQHATDWTFADGRDRSVTQRTVCLPSAWNGRPLTVELRADEPRSPASVGQGTDPRPLTIGLRRLRVRAAAAGECGP